MSRNVSFAKCEGVLGSATDHPSGYDFDEYVVYPHTDLFASLFIAGGYAMLNGPRVAELGSLVVAAELAGTNFAGNACFDTNPQLSGW